MTVFCLNGYRESRLLRISFAHEGKKTKKDPENTRTLEYSGAGEQIRTVDLRITSALLYP